MLRSHKKSHFRHLLFKCLNCSFESKQYQTLQEHLQIEGHEPYLDENIEEFLKEYSNGNLTSLNTTNNNSNSSSSTPPTLVPTSIQKPNNRLSTSKKRKSISNTSLSAPIKRSSSTSSIDSSPGAISPISNDEHQMDLINQQTISSTSVPLVCTLCDYVAASKEGLGVHLFQHACKKSDLLNRSLLASTTIDPATKLMELFNGKMGPFTGTTGQVINIFLFFIQREGRVSCTLRRLSSPFLKRKLG
jgi:hypothetical protein